MQVVQSRINTGDSAYIVDLASGDVVQLVRTLPRHPIQVISQSTSVSYAYRASSHCHQPAVASLIEQAANGSGPTVK
jgi:hypothetical protein